MVSVIDILKQAKKRVSWANNVIKNSKKSHEEICEGYGIDWFEISPRKTPRGGHTGEKVVCFAPHGDDAEFAAGVTLSNHVMDGDDVSVLLFTGGSAGRYTRGFTEKTMPIVRIAESISSAKMLGVKRFGIIILADGSMGLPEWFWDGNTPIMRRFAIGLMRKLNPHVLYAPHYDPEIDVHPDHQAVAKIAAWASGWGTENAFYNESFKGKAEAFRELRMYAIWTGTKTLPVDYITYYDPEGPFARLKNQALSVYKSQRGDLYAKAVLGFNRFQGVMRTVGDDKDLAAEVFAVKKAPQSVHARWREE